MHGKSTSTVGCSSGGSCDTNICSKVGNCTTVFLNKLFCEERMFPLILASASG